MPLHAHSCDCLPGRPAPRRCPIFLAPPVVCLLVLTLLATAAAAGAQTAPMANAQAGAPLALALHYRAGQSWNYAIVAHSQVRNASEGGGTLNATQEIRAHIGVRVLIASASGFELEIRVSDYTTSVAGDQQLTNTLNQQERQTEAAVRALPPLRAHLSANGDLDFTNFPRQSALDEPQQLIDQVVRLDVLPRAPVRVGTAWDRQRTQTLASEDLSIPIRLECTLSAADATSATIQVERRGFADLPASALPNGAEIERAGYVPQGTVSLSGSVTYTLDRADGALRALTAEAHNHVRIKLVGAGPPQNIATDIDSQTQVTRAQ